jgi:protein SCO1/2
MLDKLFKKIFFAPEAQWRLAGDEITGNLPKKTRAPAGAQDGCDLAPLPGLGVGVKHPPVISSPANLSGPFGTENEIYRMPVGRWKASSIRCLRLAARSLLLTAFCLLPSAFCLAQYAQPPQSRLPQTGTPEALRGIGIDQKLNEQVPLDLVFRDEAGRARPLREFFRGKPVILALVYYECPMLCNQVLNGLNGSLLTLSFNVGKEFDVLTVSFDPRETPAIAAAKKQSYIHRYKRPGAAEGWHFLTGDLAAIERLTQAVGFRYNWDEASKQYVHASGVMVLTAEGKLSRYFYGIEYAPKELRLGLVEASEGKIGSPVDAVLLYCFHYDPTTGKYAPVVMNILRLSGVVTVLAVILLIALLRPSWARPGRDKPAKIGGAA